MKYSRTAHISELHGGATPENRALCGDRGDHFSQRRSRQARQEKRVDVDQKAVDKADIEIVRQFVAGHGHSADVTNAS